MSWQTTRLPAKPLNDVKFFIHLIEESNGRQKTDTKHINAKELAI